jgi:hypothetical protein
VWNLNTTASALSLLSSTVPPNIYYQQGCNQKRDQICGKSDFESLHIQGMISVSNVLQKFHNLSVSTLPWWQHVQKQQQQPTNRD